jgi:hypothetical protein
MGAEDEMPPMAMEGEGGEEGSDIPPELLALMTEYGLSPEEMAALLSETEQQGAPTSEDFIDFAQQDGTLQGEEGGVEPPPGNEKDVNWSGQVSQEGGDAASRMLGMGMKSPGAV